MATPAQIANDMAAHAKYWAGRDCNIERVCRDAAWVIRSMLEGPKVDGRTYGGVHRRLLRLEMGPGWRVKGYPDLVRARLCIERLRREARC
ncbi:MAG: hypothetical protein VR71_10135 [Roseovarius sp. BRH_c41]|uniref:hypothetical protein n=1 Tax=Roseovarius sp. BRH_c41 TaxID=1629709 RepID=UPI0005F11352|nr:hypothetical protein [Roseovarius sp. BRH_c41]KJS43546.1 MAG: hypothetical protein VR71_10135 [Roseovarius sp. BRH_c41]